MGFLEKQVPYKTDSKKVASARVSEIVMSALSDASKDSDIVHGYSFTISKIIEKALNDTLVELKEKTHIDYYKLVVFQRKMEQIQTELSFEGLTHFFDFGKEVEKFKLDMFKTESSLDDCEMVAPLTAGEFDEFFFTELLQFERNIIQEWNDNLKELDIDLIVYLDGSIAPIDKKTSNR
ncbi:hypothetical protein HOB87_08355 [Candidatus Woesearchaeota archaeon]|jgi:hypothetical protein|nr:hypothetical protein [Candidatus Woesearchaeota archaeon]MBT7558244.1 hypothetical protein [Candidatus Woesearchaeota archaeon]